MITIGIDPHKRTHTAVAVSGVGELLDELTIPAGDGGHRRLLAWAQGLHAGEAVASPWEDCRGVNGRLERFLLKAGEHVLRVPPKLMANAGKGGREVGKSDPIDALAVARAALREESKLHPASTDSKARELKILVDHREARVHDRSVYSAKLRWHLHDIDPELEPAVRTLDRPAVRRSITRRLARLEQTAQVRVCRNLLVRIGEITRYEREFGCRDR
ncbi:MAG: transposase [Solirubrobacterales bacterium]